MFEEVIWEVSRGFCDRLVVRPKMVYMVVEARVVGAVGVRDPPRRPVVDHGALVVVQVVPTWHLSREHNCGTRLLGVVAVVLFSLFGV